jgi:hypothetical protein
MECYEGIKIIKGSVHPATGHEGPEEVQRYSAIPSSTSALQAGGWSTPRSDRFTADKETPYPLYRRLCTPQGWSGRVLPPGFDPRSIQGWLHSCTSVTDGGTSSASHQPLYPGGGPPQYQLNARLNGPPGTGRDERFRE